MRSPDDLRLLLARVRRRWRAQVGLRGVGRALAIFAAPLAAASVVARLLTLSDGGLTLLLAVAVLLGIAGVVLILRSIPRRPSDRQIARFIEERVGMDDELVSAVDAPEGSSAFHAFVVDRAAQRLDHVGAEAIVPGWLLRRASFEPVAGFAALYLVFILASPFLGRAAEFAWITLFPQSVRVAVDPGDVRIVAGKPVTLRASVWVGSHRLTRFTPKVTVVAGKEERAVSMFQVPEGVFLLTLEGVDRTFRYRVSAGSARSQEYTVTALFPPRVKQIDLRYDYPAFAKVGPREESNGGDIFAPVGTKVHVRVHTDKPIASGELALGGAQASLARTGERVLEGDLVLAKDDSYRIGLVDQDGLRSAGETEYFIRVMDDRPPDVRILRPGGDEQITPLEEVAIEARAEDDHGLSRFELVYAVAGREPIVMPFTRVSGTDIAKVGTHVLQAEDLKVQPGDVITYYARARDVARGKRSSLASSDMYFLEVRPFAEEFVSAQSQASSGMAGEQIEALITAQKDIINATWNIERRAASGAGRSNNDIGALASAQAELKARAEQMSPGVGRGPSPFRPPPQQIGPRSGLLPGGQPARRGGPDPVEAAVSAMGRALDQLHGQRTSEALPHEMAALQGLLQAQAEIRRREVMQQAGSGMSGSGRQGQDLSALFDKELQRQQRTNYETKPQIEQTPQRPTGDSALDKIRDLAKRQEELSKRQRELGSAGLTPEEMKRQLEKLTREQEELRQQAEELTRQMAQQQRNTSGQGQQGQQTNGLRDATEQMKSAASELQRQSPGNAADRAEQAAARLRQLEQQMREDSPEAKQRAAGELQLEAQQIADEQRRIAGEAERLEKATGTPNADAWRRLAGEKDKLADRVDALQRASERLAGSASASKTGAASAAKEIERERIPERMRETARQMRGADETPAAGGRTTKPAAPAPKVADTEQQLARALDRVVNQLGDPAGEQPGARAGGRDGAKADGAQELARQLDQAKSIREGLDGLERQLREAESKSAGGRQSSPTFAGRSSTGSGRGQQAGSAGTSDEVQRLRAEYGKAAQNARDTLSRLAREQSGGAGGGTSPEDHEWSVTDQGKEAFKQDFSQWESLKKDVNSALDRYEASVVAKAARRGLDDRLSAGGSDRVPDAYRKLIARYYESLARKK